MFYSSHHISPLPPWSGIFPGIWFLMEITQSGQQTENQVKKHESNIRDLWDNIKQANLRKIGIPEGEEKDRGIENIFGEIMAENFPNLKLTDIEIQKPERASN